MPRRLLIHFSPFAANTSHQVFPSSLRLNDTSSLINYEIRQTLCDFIPLHLSLSPHKHTHTHFFHSSPQQILEKTDQVLKAGTDLQQSSHTDQQSVQWLMGKIKQLMTDFDDRLGKRKKKLDDSVKLHRLTESVSVVGVGCHWVSILSWQPYSLSVY